MAHRARKRFGQHFLADRDVIARVVAAVAPAQSDTMLEIGPGLGALTRSLVGHVEALHAVEIDRDIVARLRAEFPPERLTVHEGDALDYDFAAHGPGLRVVGNLPYNISSPILFRLAGSATTLKDAHVMLQREVVERMVAAPASPHYGRLSVMLQYHFAMAQLFAVPAQAFHPPPKVESAFVRMLPAPARPDCDPALLERVVRAAFSQRRKTLRNTLKGLFTPPELEHLGIDPGARAQQLGLDEFARLANALTRGDVE